jgi:hypothetical protein
MGLAKQADCPYAQNRLRFQQRNAGDFRALFELVRDQRGKVKHDAF